jgi:hypothetical protein
VSAAQIAIGLVSLAIEMVLFVVLVWRRHYRREPLFALYIGAIVLSNAAVGLWWRWDVWLLHQAVSAAARFGVALGLAYGVFRNFPGAAVTARRVLLFVLVITLTAAISLAGADTGYADASAMLVSRIANGTVWLFTALAALVLWYRVPLRGLQKAILLGFAPYLLVFTVAMNLLSTVGWHVRTHVGYADTLAYMALMSYWTIAAWRPAEAEALVPAGIPSPVVMDLESRERPGA